MDYLKDQLITYLGNKRSLIPNIEDVVLKIKNELKSETFTSVDLFSGSGVVARMLKVHSDLIIANDLELYYRYKVKKTSRNSFSKLIERENLADNKLAIARHIIDSLIEQAVKKIKQNTPKIKYTSNQINTLLAKLNLCPDNIKAILLNK